MALSGMILFSIPSGFGLGFGSTSGVRLKKASPVALSSGVLARLIERTFSIRMHWRLIGCHLKPKGQLCCTKRRGLDVVVMASVDDGLVLARVVSDVREVSVMRCVVREDLTGLLVARPSFVVVGNVDDVTLLLVARGASSAPMATAAAHTRIMMVWGHLIVVAAS